jgi:hypothetical protein
MKLYLDGSTSDKTICEQKMVILFSFVHSNTYNLDISRKTIAKREISSVDNALQPLIFSYILK